MTLDVISAKTECLSLIQKVTLSENEGNSLSSFHSAYDYSVHANVCWQYVWG